MTALCLRFSAILIFMSNYWFHVSVYDTMAGRNHKIQHVQGIKTFMYVISMQLVADLTILWLLLKKEIENQPVKMQSINLIFVW